MKTKPMMSSTSDKSVRILCATAAILLMPGLRAIEGPLDRAGEATWYWSDDGQKAIKVLEKWIATYRKGKVDCGNIFLDISSKSTAKKAGLVDKDRFGDRGGIKPGEFSYRDELILLCELVSATNSEDAAKVMLQVAAVGLDRDTKYTSDMSPVFVRSVGEEFIGKFNSASSREYFLKAAAGQPDGPAELHSALQAAAIKVLARFESEDYIPPMMAGLESTDPLVRAHAADGLALIGVRGAIGPIADAFEKETDQTAQVAYAQALKRIYLAHQGQVDTEAFRRGLQRAVQCMRVGAWQTDVAMMQLLEDFPLAETVPVLIELIVRFVEHPEEVEQGILTGVQRTRAYEALVRLTGAFYAIDDAESWKTFWERVGANFKVVDLEKNREQLMADFAAEEAKRKAEQQSVGGAKEIKTAKRMQSVGTVTNDFFGIPILGSRVVFVLDVSGSMSLPMTLTNPENAKKEWRNGSDRLEVAKEEIRSTIERLTEDVYFNIVTYHDDVELWQEKKLVQATKKNKEAAYKFLRKLSPTMNTNIYDGVAEALRIASLVYGDRYENNIDEMFLLSDGVPNRGAIRMDNDILTTINETNRFSRVKINTVFTGKPNDEADPGERGMKLMKNIAEANDGRFIRP